MNPFLTCSSLPQPLHRSAIRSPHRQSHCRPIWALYAALTPSLAEVQAMEKRNLAAEALQKLINDEIRSHGRTNVVQMRAFSERLEQAVARYHTNAITTAQVLQELIALAKDIRASRQRGEEQGLSDEEIAFYDALAENDSAI